MPSDHLARWCAIGCSVLTATATACYSVYKMRLELIERRELAVGSSPTEDEEEDMDGRETDRSKTVFRIVLTGGPCAGKTTALARLSSFLSERGLRVFTVPEAATLLFANGVAFSDIDGLEAALTFQRALIDLQTTLEDGFARVAAQTGKPAVLLCDRGLLDGSAYISRQTWAELLRRRRDDDGERRNFDLEAAEIAICERYDAIFHLVTAAAGAERYYSLENNATRTETPELAREQDAKTQLVWAMHPHQYVFDNSSVEAGFEGKLQRVVETSAKLVGLPVLPKGTRKFLLEECPEELNFDYHSITLTSFTVTKTFLQGVSDPEIMVHSYVRKRLQGGVASYGYAEVRRDVDELFHERKRRISRREYLAHLASADPERAPVEQKRFHFLWCNQSFVIHKYKDRDLAILHCQAARPDGSIDFPPFLKVGPEVSGDASNSAYMLSVKKQANIDYASNKPPAAVPSSQKKKKKNQNRRS